MRTHAQANDLAKVREWSDESAIRCPPGEDKARQEFKEEADVNVILRKFGAGGFEPRPVVYGSQDFDLDLQSVYSAAEEAQAGWLRLPEHLRRRYPGWPELLAAVDRGEASLVDAEGVQVPPAKEEVPPVAG